MIFFRCLPASPGGPGIERGAPCGTPYTKWRLRNEPKIHSGRKFGQCTRGEVRPGRSGCLLVLRLLPRHTPVRFPLSPSGRGVVVEDEAPSDMPLPAVLPLTAPANGTDCSTDQVLHPDFQPPRARTRFFGTPSRSNFVAVAPRREWALKIWTSRPTRFMTSSVRLAIRWASKHFAGAFTCRKKNFLGNRTWRPRFFGWPLPLVVAN